MSSTVPIVLYGADARTIHPKNVVLREAKPVLEFLKNLWGLGTDYRNRVVVPARQATQPGGIGSLESILGLLKS
jgi:hypothetical protein